MLSSASLSYPISNLLTLDYLSKPSLLSASVLIFPPMLQIDYESKSIASQSLHLTIKADHISWIFCYSSQRQLYSCSYWQAALPRHYFSLQGAHLFILTEILSLLILNFNQKGLERLDCISSISVTKNIYLGWPSSVFLYLIYIKSAQNQTMSLDSLDFPLVIHGQPLASHVINRCHQQHNKFWKSQYRPVVRQRLSQANFGDERKIHYNGFIKRRGCGQTKIYFLPFQILI